MKILATSISIQPNKALESPKTSTSSWELSPNAKAFLRTIWIGGISGFGADALTYPLYNIKTRLQTSETPVRPKISEVAKKIFKENGAKGFMDGSSLFLLSAFPASALFFYGRELGKKLGGEGHFGHLLSGACAQALGGVVWVPASVLAETKIQATMQQISTINGIRQMSQHIFKKQGFSGFYKGYWAQFFTYMPATSIASDLSSVLKKKTDNSSNPGVTFGINAFSFAVAGIATNPVDVIRTNMQVSTIKGDIYGKVINCCKILWKNGGIESFFQGGIARGTWLGLRQGFAFTAMDILNGINPSLQE